jgi:hypothetical protein
MMGHNAQVVLAWGISVTLSLTALGLGAAAFEMITRLRVCPDTFGRIPEFSEDEPN